MKYFIFLIPFICFGYTISHNNLDIETSEKSSYSVGYSEEHEQPIWCLYTVTSNQLCLSQKFKRTNNFRVDTNITTISSSPKDYLRSGFDKGHLCPAQDRGYSLESISETFLMSNMCPQDPSFNRGIWKRLEDATRKFAIKYGSVDVICGPVIFNRHDSITNNVSIPQMFYKILVSKVDDKTEILAFVFPNQQSEDSLINFCVPVCFIESISGLIFDLDCDDIHKRYINYNMILEF